MTLKESDIVWQGEVCYVLAKGNTFEVCVHSPDFSHGRVAGDSKDREKAIKTAKGLDRHPDKARQFVGFAR